MIDGVSTLDADKELQKLIEQNKNKSDHRK